MTVVSLPQTVATHGRQWSFNDVQARRAFTKVAVPALFRLAQAWELGDARLGEALGGVSVSTVRRWKKAPPEELNFDELTRASYLLGIYQALHVILDDQNADAWPTGPNDAPLFGGQSPVDTMVRGGIVTMDRVRAYVDAVRGGQ